MHMHIHCMEYPDIEEILAYLAVQGNSRCVAIIIPQVCDDLVRLRDDKRRLVVGIHKDRELRLAALSKCFRAISALTDYN